VITPADSAPQAPGQMPASSWDIQAPYSPGEPGHIGVHGDADPGGSDKTAGDVAGAVAAAQARQHELESDTFGMGSVIGDLMDLPSNPGAFYDPPRD
jgi:hypothetical protein